MIVDDLMYSAYSFVGLGEVDGEAGYQSDRAINDPRNSDKISSSPAKNYKHST